MDDQIKKNWEGIEDSSHKPNRVWLSRLSDDDEWKPLRVCDCNALNSCEKDGQVYVEGGRATADLKKNEIRFNFFDFPDRQLTSAIWFQREDANNKSDSSNENRNSKYYLAPITCLEDEVIIEGLYKNAVKHYRSRNEKALLSLEADLKIEDEHKVNVVKVGGSFSVRKRPKNSLKAFVSLEGPTELQRGYGHYVVEGEEEEMALGPVRNLIFVVHGIGEAVWSRDDVGIQGRLEEAEEARNALNKKMYNVWKKECAQLKKQGKKAPLPPNRIELIPVTWFGEIHSSSSTLKNTLLSTTLQSVPQLRVIANDVVFDVLMYLTPAFCEEVLTTVTNKISKFYDHFQIVHNDFIANGGRCSLVGHSLGSVICWDLLSVLQDSLYCGNSLNVEVNTGFNESSMYPLPSFDASAPQAYETYADESSGEVKSGTWGPSLKQKLSRTIPFTPKFTMFLGSPLGMFLSLRGAQPLFNDMRLTAEAVQKRRIDDIDEDDEKIAPSSPFTLPSGSIYNIFNSSDPVAYRIEPLLLPPGTDQSDIPPPQFLVPDSTGMRFHVKAKEISGNVINTFSGLLKSSLEKLPEAIPTSSSFQSTNHSKKEDCTFKFALGGNNNVRVDYQLQPGVVENEYLSAIMAHSTYFANDDLLEFLIQCSNEK